jgi:hypothetical protein
MAFTRAQAYETLAALHPAPVFLQAYEVKRLPEDLDIYFGPPEEFFLAPETQEPYTRGRLVPLLDDGNFGVVTFYDLATRSLVQIDVESPDEVRATFWCWQQYLADLVIEVAESVESDERLRRMAELMQFRCTTELLAVLHRAADLPPQEYQAARRQFLSSIPASDGRLGGRATTEVE